MVHEAECPSTDPGLLQLLANAKIDECAWSSFFVSYQPLIISWALRAGLQYDDANDVASRVLLKLIRSMPQFRLDPAHRFRGWLKTIVNNVIRSFWNERLRRGRLMIASNRFDSIPAPLNELGDELDEQVRQRLIQADALLAQVKARVHETTWSAFWLTEAERRLPAEVARMLCIPPSYVNVYRWRVRRLLKREYERVAQRDLRPRPE